MYGYKVRLSGLPKALFACSTTLDNYFWENNHNKNTLEISIAKSDLHIIKVNGETHQFSNTPLLSCTVGNDERCSWCNEGVKIEITCVGVSFEDLTITNCELSEADAYDNSYFLLPAIFDNIVLAQAVTPLLNKYINKYTSGTAYDNALCISIWFEMLYLIDKHTRDFLCKQKNHSDNYYIKKINYIIESRFSEKLSLTKIAEEFGVSMSYLSNTYSLAMQRSFKDALFETRMKKAKELIIEDTLSTEEIADAVGLCDDVYLRKCFKKFYGVSISEFKKINRGLTLYHDKPIRK